MTRKQLLIVAHFFMMKAMYGSEFWCLNDSLLSRLECFQAEVGKRILRLLGGFPSLLLVLAVLLLDTLAEYHGLVSQIIIYCTIQKVFISFSGIGNIMPLCNTQIPEARYIEILHMTSINNNTSVPEYS